MLENLLKLNIDVDKIIEDFVHKFLYTDSNIKEAHFEVIKGVFVEIIKDILANNDSLEHDCIKLAKLNLRNEVPFIVLMHELHYLKKVFLSIFMDSSAVYEMLLLYEIYMKVEKYVAKEYLDVYLNKLSLSNNNRLNSLNDMVGIDLIGYYKQHVLWLDSLVASVRDLKPDSIPELDSTLCAFGYWLANDAKKIITDEYEYKKLKKIHEKLHGIAFLITKQFHKREIDYHILLTYIESCEYISLSIGIELALLDNSMMIKKIQKDELTGALCNNSLNMLFKNQYEISLATDSSFVLAMCGLDNLENTTAMYGDVARDKLLVKFVNTVNETLRDSDIVIRDRGEQFIIIFLNTSSKIAIKKLEKIRICLENFELNYENNMLQTTVSIGHIEIKPMNDIQHNNISVVHYMNLVGRNLLSAQREGMNAVV
jgi:diguanylate cyclase (GGDEF)-like protein